MAFTSMNASSTGLSALSTSLEVIANNLANTNTDGFKASRVNFQDLLYMEKRQPGIENDIGDISPTGLYVGVGTRASGTQTDFAQGSSVFTSQPLDVMINGDGFFMVEVEDTWTDGLAYTRAGNFSLNAERELVMANLNGRRIVPSIVVPYDVPETSIVITDTGLVQVSRGAEFEEIGQLELAYFANSAGLQPIGENLYVETIASGEVSASIPTENGLGNLIQFHLEASNVNPVTELVSLIETQRAFEMNSQALKTADEMLQNVTNLRRF
ncbi:MAG: flagellar basal-body rod protein FlgG [Planctomycetota bacterium]|nr:flagellar basal-body rod protein FlgG [Planctomycetota bacterium]|tara:strand:+ start:33002 stop:33811 length:810 start_codon:yes stop_codon:yes gene_type:complete